MPSVGQDSGFALRTITGKEVQGLVVTIGIAHRHDDLTGLDVEHSIPESLVQPKLLERHLATFLRLGLILARLFRFYLHGRLVAAVLKLHLGAKRPTVAKVIAQVERDMGKVKAPVAIVVLVACGGIVSVETLTIEISGHHRFAITSKAQTGEGFLYFAHTDGVGHLPCGSRHSIHRPCHTYGCTGCTHHDGHYFSKHNLWFILFWVQRYGLVDGSTILKYGDFDTSTRYTHTQFA